MVICTKSTDKSWLHAGNLRKIMVTCTKFVLEVISQRAGIENRKGNGEIYEKICGSYRGKLGDWDGVCKNPGKGRLWVNLNGAQRGTSGENKEDSQDRM